VLKRFLDIILSIIALFIFFTPMLLIAAILLLIQGRPILFKQIRPGVHEKPFDLLKFRTMSLDPNQYDARNIQISDKDRITNLGRWLRASSLDELPSLINVLKGNMSVVGPRPLLMHYLKLYSDEQKIRHEVKPGITGWAQINGRNNISWPEKLSLDVWYVKNRSMTLDIKILFLTIGKVIKREGISSKGEVTGEEFTGQKK
jgi:sugar transferase EpsL